MSPCADRCRTSITNLLLAGVSDNGVSFDSFLVGDRVFGSVLDTSGLRRALRPRRDDGEAVDRQAHPRPGSPRARWREPAIRLSRASVVSPLALKATADPRLWPRSWPRATSARTSRRYGAATSCACSNRLGPWPMRQRSPHSRHQLERWSRGTQNKVLEAMGGGPAVVAPGVAANGIDHAGTMRIITIVPPAMLILRTAAC
jgi:hypothetical protein